MARLERSESSTQPRQGLIAGLRRVSVKAWLRMAILVAVLATGFLIVRLTPLGDYLTRDNIVALQEQLRSSPWSAGGLVLGYFVLAPLGVPMSPLVLAGAVVFGSLWGSVYNILGLVLGAMSAFFVAKALGRELIVQLAGQRLRRAERVFERRGFWPLVQTRFLPIPFPLVSYGAALAGVSASRFFITSTLGLIPSTAIHSYFMAEVYRRPAPLTLALYIATFAVFNLLVGWPTLREGLRRRRRYRELVERRRTRAF